VLRLIFHDPLEAPAAVVEASEIRITGGVLWSHSEHGLIACYSCGSWKHRGRYFPSISVAGGCVLVFGITRDALVSDPISLFAVTGNVFRANGVAIAEYDEKRDLWQGLIRRITWQSMRILSAAAASAVTDSDRPMILNPWDYPGDERPSATSSSK
jgi:hypothetical protein